MIKVIAPWQDRRDADGREVRATPRYVEALSATDAVRRGRWMHSAACQAAAEKHQEPSSDFCDGRCMTESRY